MAGPVTTRADDERILSILHDLDGDGMTFSQAAAKRRGLTGGSIAGIKHRTVRASDKIACLCIKPENKDGAMGPLWWRK